MRGHLGGRKVSGGHAIDGCTAILKEGFKPRLELEMNGEGKVRDGEKNKRGGRGR